MRRAMFLVVVLLSCFAMAAEPAKWSSQLPRVRSLELPIYPVSARAAKVQGDVRLQVTTDGEHVTDVKVLAGKPMLAKAAKNNVRSWTFISKARSSFEVTFAFRMVSSAADNYDELEAMLPEAQVRADFPLRVEVISVPSDDGGRDPDEHEWL